MEKNWAKYTADKRNRDILNDKQFCIAMISMITMFFLALWI